MFRESQQIGPYTLIRKLGRGAFGEVWLAENRAKYATTQVAVKLPHPDQVDPAAIAQEAQLWARANGHSNILPIIEANEYDGQVVIVSEYAPDGSLEDWVKEKGKLPVEKAVEMTIQILDGLEFLHSRKIIHRDLKPANILLQGKTLRVADFGVSRALKTSVHASNAAGTPYYMSPEAFARQRTVQTDIWSVGVILYLLLRGDLPFKGEILPEIYNAIVKEEPDPLSDDIPIGLRDIVLKSLEKAPGNRHQSAEDMQEDLRRFLKENLEETIRTPYYETLRNEASTKIPNVATDLHLIETQRGLPLQISNKTEYIEEPFPSLRLLHWKSGNAFPDVSPPDFDLIVTQEVLTGVNQHVSESLDRELGGILLGNLYTCPVRKRKYIKIDIFEKARENPSDEISTDFTNGILVDLQDKLEGKYRGKQLLGWYHSHPRMAVFLSPMDLEVHNSRFPDPLSVALVIEPEKMTGGFFCWRNDELHPHTVMDFYELREHGSTETHVPWTNYDCFDASGKQVSPKLAALKLPVAAQNPVPVVLPSRSYRPRSKFDLRIYILYWFAFVMIAIVVAIIGWAFYPWASLGTADNKNTKSNNANLLENMPTPNAKPSPVKGAEPVKVAYFFSKDGLGLCSPEKCYLFFDYPAEKLEIKLDGKDASYTSSDIDAVRWKIPVENSRAFNKLKIAGDESVPLGIEIFADGKKVDVSNILMDSKIFEPAPTQQKNKSLGPSTKRVIPKPTPFAPHDDLKKEFSERKKREL